MNFERLYKTKVLQDLEYHFNRHKRDLVEESAEVTIEWMKDAYNAGLLEASREIMDTGCNNDDELELRDYLCERISELTV